MNEPGTKPRLLLRQVDVGGERGQAVAEPSVDPAFRGVERRDRLSALVGIRQLRPHQLCESAAAAVSREDADAHDARGRDLPRPGNGGLEQVCAGPADDLTVFEGRMDPFRRDDRPKAIDVLVGGGVAEVVPDSVERTPHLVRGAHPHLDRHQAIRSSGA